MLAANDQIVSTQIDVKGPLVVTGGAGFVGSNLVHRLVALGHKAIVLDDLSRPRVAENLAWLTELHGGALQVEVGDVCDAALVRGAVAEAGGVFHLAAQATATLGLEDPRRDFEVNTLGTLNVLEAVRSCKEPPFLVYSSTSRVYGGLVDLAIQEIEGRHQPVEPLVRSRGVSELRRLDFRSPYGCSKGAADQYVTDYARCYDLPTVVFRMSSVYGPRQSGTEEQGFVADFFLRALAHAPITVYGDGKQVHDLLFIDDLIDALLLAAAGARQLRGRVFNIGGGPHNAVSLRDVLRQISELIGRTPDVAYAGWRPSEQRYYVSDSRAFRSATGWTPRTDVASGLHKLYAWLAKAGMPKAELGRAAL